MSQPRWRTLARAKSRVDLSQDEEARRCYVEALGLMEAHPGQFGLEKRRAIWGLANIYCRTGDTARAQQMFESNIRHLERVAGKRQLTTFFAYMDLFDFHHQNKDTKSAKAVLDTVLPRAKRIDSTSHNALRLFTRLGWACFDHDMIDEATSFFGKAYEGWRDEDPNSTATLDAANIFCQALSSAFRDAYITRDQICPQYIEELARVMLRSPQMQNLHPYNLACLCLRAGDEKSATFAYKNWPRSNFEFQCDGCKAEMKHQEQASLACRVCWNIDLCLDCHEALRSGEGKVAKEIRQTCTAHSFFLVEEGALAGSEEEQADAIKTWLSELIFEYSQMATVSLVPRITNTISKPTKDEDLVVDDFEEVSFETNFIAGKPDDQVSADEMSVLLTDLQKCRETWAFSRTPALLKRFFAAEGPYSLIYCCCKSSRC